MNPKNFPHRKQERKKSALERQAESNRRTPSERLARLDERGLTAAKERAKLMAKMGK